LFLIGEPHAKSEAPEQKLEEKEGKKKKKLERRKSGQFS
jgi:hypothetical protein